MGLGQWIRRLMESDDGYEEMPDEVITVGYVSILSSQMVVSELAAAGIRAEAAEQRAGYGGPIKTRILCFARDRDAAAAIIDRFLAADEVGTEPLD